MISKGLSPILHWLLLAAVLLTGCQKRVDYAVLNATGTEISAVECSIGKSHTFRHGTLSDGAQKSFGGSITDPGDCEVIISWLDNSRSRSQSTTSVSQEEIFDKRQIVFRIEPDQSITKRWRFDSPPQPLKGL